MGRSRGSWLMVNGSWLGWRVNSHFALQRRLKSLKPISLLPPAAAHSPTTPFPPRKAINLLTR